MKPTRSGDAVVDLADVLLRDGVVVDADVVVTVADVPLVGIRLRAAVAGMATMAEYGYFEDWASGSPSTPDPAPTGPPEAASGPTADDG